MLSTLFFLSEACCDKILNLEEQLADCQDALRKVDGNESVFIESPSSYDGSTTTDDSNGDDEIANFLQVQTSRTRKPNQNSGQSAKSGKQKSKAKTTDSSKNPEFFDSYFPKATRRPADKSGTSRVNQTKIPNGNGSDVKGHNVQFKRNSPSPPGYVSQSVVDNQSIAEKSMDESSDLEMPPLESPYVPSKRSSVAPMDSRPTLSSAEIGQIFSNNVGKMAASHFPNLLPRPM